MSDDVSIADLCRAPTARSEPMQDRHGRLLSVAKQRDLEERAHRFRLERDRVAPEKRG
ncbi:MAG: hypothetical protein AAF909_11535 [Pseudomonadota bacterium]